MGSGTRRWGRDVPQIACGCRPIRTRQGSRVRNRSAHRPRRRRRRLLATAFRRKREWLQLVARRSLLVRRSARPRDSRTLVPGAEAEVTERGFDKRRRRRTPLTAAPFIANPDAAECARGRPTHACVSRFGAVRLRETRGESSGAQRSRVDQPDFGLGRGSDRLEILLVHRLVGRMRVDPAVAQRALLAGIWGQAKAGRLHGRRGALRPLLPSLQCGRPRRRPRDACKGRGRGVHVAPAHTPLRRADAGVGMRHDSVHDRPRRAIRTRIRTAGRVCSWVRAVKPLAPSGPSRCYSNRRDRDYVMSSSRRQKGRKATPKTRKPRRCHAVLGFRSGETRTRTGDTTIFSPGAKPL
jgi:hypothetical protein